MFTLAHLSDPHISPLPPVRVMDLIGKRLVGFTNWRLRRSVRHDPAAMAAIERDIKAAKPDHIAVLGDLVNICLPAEFPRAAAFLARLGAPQDVSLVPGNHDAYVRAHARTFLSAWRANLTGDTPAANGEPFPFVRRRGPVALIGLSTALPTLPFLATGTLGRRQLERLSALLRDIQREGLFRVVLLHHPPAGKRAPHKVLTDAGAFREVIAAHGAELILHGHDHCRSMRTLKGPRGDVPLLGVPSASAPGTDGLPGGWNLYRIDGTAGAWRCEVELRELKPDGTVTAAATARLI
jgi:3',5'-cyclic AMP phosphodiesterase CpdA